MTEFEPKFAGFRDKVRTSFSQQPAMATLGVELSLVEPGRGELRMPRNKAFGQQHGFVHAGILSTAMDSACGYAAYSLMEENAEVLTVEFKVNLMAPANGETFLFVGKVIKPGRTLTFVEGAAYVLNGADRRKIATMAATMMAIVDRAGVNN
ncbi:MAG: PaaI family thioesterase [Rhizobiaceae bacterium]